MDNIFSKRLYNARKMAGFSMDQLASASGLSKNAISRYENGIMKPDSSNLIKLAKALNVKIDYFFRNSAVELHHVEFRKKSKLLKSQVESIKFRVLDQVERYLELENILAINTQFVNPIEGIQIRNSGDIEAVADKVRHEWNIGQNPVPSVIEMLEDNHIKVVEVDEADDFDGLSSMIDGKIPVIVVNKNFIVERKRFTLLHELGHLLMKLPEDISVKEKEKMCHRFAGAFLVPLKRFISELGSKRTKILVDELIPMQMEWGISIKAIMQRASDLGVITSSYLKQFYIRLNLTPSLKNKIDESRYSFVEKSYRFTQLLYKGIAQELVSLSKASVLSNKPLNELKTSLNYI
ncbi:helix-turn-helix domain-containing protein [Saccharicrinis sp. FJH62]